METREGVVTRDSLHRLIEAPPDQNLTAAKEAIEPLADPFLVALANAPIDDELESDEEHAAVEEAKLELERGEYLTMDDVKRELGLT